VSHSPPLVEIKLSGVVLVCGDCEERSDGPTKLKAKQVRKELKRDLVHVPGRLRVVQSTCLGLCPKKATAVAAATGEGPLRLAAVGGKSDVQAVADRLRRRR